MIRILLADDHPGLRSVVRADLVEAGFVVCAEAGDAQSAIAAAVREHPDVCLLDIRMPGSGLVAAWEISAALPDTKVVMLTVSRSEEHMVAALRAGAVGYLFKDLDSKRLAEEMKRFVSGEVRVPRPAVMRLTQAPPRKMRRAKRELPEALTQYEQQLLGLLADGMTISTAASRLGEAEDDARRRVEAIRGKLRFADRASLAQAELAR